MNEEIEISSFNEEPIANARKLISEYKFNLGELSTTITIRLYKLINNHQVAFEQSHFIHTPTQVGPYITSRPYNDNESSALRQAITGFTQYYDAAVREGHQPNDSWLKVNEHFK